MTAIEIQTHLGQLESERMLATLIGLGSDPAYTDDLADEITATRHAYVGAAVTEIATLRTELSAPQWG